MAKLKPFLISLCLLLFTSSSLSARFESADRFNQCQLDRINALEPDHRVESEAGLTETWNPRHPELQCAGVSLIRRTIDPKGLHLPSFSPAPQLVMILQGRGVLGMSVPGCPQTYEEPQYRQQGSSSSRSREQQQRPDRHQKIRRFSRGDVIAIPPGTPYWTYNNGNEPLVAISLLDTSNLANQLDSTPRVFYLGGNPDLEYPETQQQQREQGRHQQRRSPGGRRGGQHQEEGEEQQQNEGGSVLSGFSPEFLAQSLNTDKDTARRLQSAHDERRQIVRVEDELSFISPDWQEEEEEQEEEQEEGGRSRQQPCRRHKRQQEGEEEEEEEDQPRRRQRGDEEEDQPRRRRHGEEEERESRRSRGEQEEEDQPRRRRHGEEEERESRRSRGEQEEEDQPRRRRHGEEEEQEPRRSRGEEEEEEEEDQPRSRETRQWSRRQHREERREPGRRREEEEGEEEEQRTERRSSSDRRGRGRNGIEETICTAKVRENIARPERADIYNPRAGRISTVNSLTLPILRFLRLSAEYVNLYRNGIYAPHWNINANSLMYVIRGRGRVQIVNCQGNSVFNDEVRKGQLIVVPQNFVVAQQAEEEGFEYVVFKTNDRAAVNHVKEVFRSTPAEVLENAFGLRQRQVTEIKFSGNRGPLVHPQSQSHDRVIAKVA